MLELEVHINKNESLTYAWVAQPAPRDLEVTCHVVKGLSGPVSKLHRQLEKLDAHGAP